MFGAFSAYCYRSRVSVIEVSKLRWRIAQSVEAWWWRRYLANKDVATYLRWKQDYWDEFLNAVDVHPEAGAAVLDAGCGPAGIFIALPQQRVVAVDPLLAAYSSLAHFDKSWYPYVRFEQTALEHYNKNSRFDYIFSLNVVNHVKDLATVLLVLAKAATDDATLVISVDAHRWGISQAVFRTVPGDILHPHQLNLEEYRQAFAAAGLTVERSIVYKRELLFDYVVLVCRKSATK